MPLPWGRRSAPAGSLPDRLGVVGHDGPAGPVVNVRRADPTPHIVEMGDAEIEAEAGPARHLRQGAVEVGRGEDQGFGLAAREALRAQGVVIGIARRVVNMSG